MFLRRQAITGMQSIAFAQKRGFVARERRALIELSLNLAVEPADRPATPQGFSLVKRARELASDRQESDVVRSRKREASRAVPSKSRDQLCRRRLHNPVPARKLR